IKRFGDLEVLAGLDLDVKAGERVALIGPSGSGKSTVLRILMTLEDIQAGEIDLFGDALWRSEDGRAVAAPRPRRLALTRRLGMVFQHFNLFPHMRVLDNVTEAPIHVLGLGRAEAETRARALLGQVGLA